MRVKLPVPKKPTGVGLDTHEVFFGTSNRANSKKWGCVIYLPHLNDHQYDREMSPHQNYDAREEMCMDYQKRLMDAGWTLNEFMETFGQNWLPEDLLKEQYGETPTARRRSNYL
jgi:hypothetical protein